MATQIDQGFNLDKFVDFLKQGWKNLENEKREPSTDVEKSIFLNGLSIQQENESTFFDYAKSRTRATGDPRYFLGMADATAFDPSQSSQQDKRTITLTEDVSIVTLKGQVSYKEIPQEKLGLQQLVLDNKQELFDVGAAAVAAATAATKKDVSTVVSKVTDVFDKVGKLDVAFNKLEDRTEVKEQKKTLTVARGTEITAEAGNAVVSGFRVIPEEVVTPVIKKFVVKNTAPTPFKVPGSDEESTVSPGTLPGVYRYTEKDAPPPGRRFWGSRQIERSGVQDPSFPEFVEFIRKKDLLPIGRSISETAKNVGKSIFGRNVITLQDYVNVYAAPISKLYEAYLGSITDAKEKEQFQETIAPVANGLQIKQSGEIKVEGFKIENVGRYNYGALLPGGEFEAAGKDILPNLGQEPVNLTRAQAFVRNPLPGSAPQEEASQEAAETLAESVDGTAEDDQISLNRQSDAYFGGDGDDQYVLKVDDLVDGDSGLQITDSEGENQLILDGDLNNGNFDVRFSRLEDDLIIHTDGDLRLDEEEDIAWNDFFDDDADNSIKINGEELSKGDILDRLPQELNIFGSSGNDQDLDASDEKEPNLVNGRDGDDNLFGYRLDTLIGGVGNDTLNANDRAENGNNLLLAGEGEDTLILGNKSTVYGGDGNDVFIQGENAAGGNFLVGGEGQDRFEMNADAAILGTPNRILDFNPREDSFTITSSATELGPIETVVGENEVTVSTQGNPIAILNPFNGIAVAEVGSFLQAQFSTIADSLS